MIPCLHPIIFSVCYNLEYTKESMDQSASLVAALMSRVIPNEAQEIEKHVQKVKECFDESMFQLSELIERHYAYNDVTSVILIDLQKLSSDITEIQTGYKKKIDQEFGITDLDAKKREFVDEITRIDKLLASVRGLIKFQEFHRDCMVAVQGNFYVQAVSSGVAAGRALIFMGSIVPDNLFLHIRRNYELNMELIRDCVRKVWFEVVKLKGPKHILDYEEAICIEVSLSTQFESYSMQEICQMLSDLNIFSVLFRQFSDLFLDFLIKPIFNIPTISVVINNLGLRDEINFLYDKSLNNWENIPKFLTEVIRIVSQLFLTFELGRKSLIEFGCVILGPVAQSLKSLLLDLEVTMTETIKSDWLKFEEELVSFGMITSEQKVINCLIYKVASIIREKRRTTILGEMRTLLKSELSLTSNVWIKIEERRLSNQFSEFDSDFKSSIHLSSQPISHLEINYLDENLFIFPPCQVSTFVIEFIKRCQVLMLEATHNSSQHAFELLKTIRLVLQLFISLTPFYHNTHISSVPRSTAIYYNNCMFVAHHLVTLGFEFRQDMPSPLNSELCTFIDLIPIIRNLGEVIWLEMVNMQKSITIEFVSVLQYTISGMDGKKGDLLQKSLVALISHLAYLSKTWKDVLPLHIVRGTIGVLVDSVLSVCINSVFQLSDIASRDASRAASIFSFLGNQSKDLFHLDPPVENEMREVCDEWCRFNELILLLDASLKLIQERWGQGKGPFGQNFLVSEITNFIKGSFKSSEKRTELLLCIV